MIRLIGLNELTIHSFLRKHHIEIQKKLLKVYHQRVSWDRISLLVLHVGHHGGVGRGRGVARAGRLWPRPPSPDTRRLSRFLNVGCGGRLLLFLLLVPGPEVVDQRPAEDDGRSDAHAQEEKAPVCPVAAAKLPVLGEAEEEAAPTPSLDMMKATEAGEEDTEATHPTSWYRHMLTLLQLGGHWLHLRVWRTRLSGPSGNAGCQQLLPPSVHYRPPVVRRTLTGQVNTLTSDLISISCLSCLTDFANFKWTSNLAF